MSEDFIRALGALILVIGLMGGLAWFAKRFGLAGAQPINSQSKKRLLVVESLPLDARRRAVLIKRDDVEHLVILGAQSETVIEAGIPSNDDSP